LAKKITRNR